MDLGCGTGSVALYAACRLHRGKGVVLGVDIKEDRLQCARERLGVLERELGVPLPCEFRREGLLSLSTKERFDLIYLEEAFHHMEPRAQVVERIARLTGPGGRVVVSEVNACNPFMQLSLLKKRGLRTRGEYRSADGRRYLYGRERIAPAGAVARQFMRRGFKIDSNRYFRVFPASCARHSMADRVPLRAVEDCIARIPPRRPPPVCSLQPRAAKAAGARVRDRVGEGASRAPDLATGCGRIGP